MSNGGWQESDFVQIVWESLLQAVDWSTRPEQIGTQAANQVKVGLYDYYILEP